MIEADEVDTLIVKDMSRLGREYLQVGQLTELYLPTKGVRFIAINDGVDSLVEQGRRIPSWSSRPTRPRLLRFPPPQLPRPAGW